MKNPKLNGCLLALVVWAVPALQAQPAPPEQPVSPWLKQALSDLDQLAGTNAVKVASHRITLGHIDPTRATQLLKLHGYTIGKPEDSVNPAQLPVIIALPGTTFHETVPKATDKFPQTETDPINELVVFHNENEPRQISKLLDLMKREIDKPARQIIIEAMILEISSTALKELGVKWTRNGSATASGNFINNKLSALTIGSLKHPGADEALNLTTQNIFANLNAQIKALVREGEAEVLSRPSVLALNNRMAYINVSEDIPVANTSYAPGNNYQRTSFDVKKAGITLALRPRMDGRGEMVNMQVNAEVTAKVPDADVQVKNSSGTVLASSPTISKREVRTYVSVANNTPFIIGGLIAKDKQSTKDRVPVLGSLPLLGPFFQSKKDTTIKREVIIVLTPFVLPEDHVIGKNMPKDEDAFDSVGNQLFRDAYRIRAEDTFDLSYLFQNKQLMRMKALANRIVADNVMLGARYPYNKFHENAVPGETILCYRQIYEVLKRQDMQSKLNSAKLIIFEADKNIAAGHRVVFLEEYLRKNAPGVLTERGNGQAVALTFTLQRFADTAKSIFREPIPTVTTLACPSPTAWRQRLWEMNQPTEQGQQQFTVLLHRAKDVERLKYAVLMKKTVDLNTRKNVLKLNQFTRGRLLLMPRVKANDIELVDGDVARSFYYSELYYQASQAEMERDITAFRQVVENKNHLQQLLQPLRR